MDEGGARDLTPLEKAKKYRNDETRRGIRARHADSYGEEDNRVAFGANVFGAQRTGALKRALPGTKTQDARVLAKCHHTQEEGFNLRQVAYWSNAHLPPEFSSPSKSFIGLGPFLV